AQILKSCIRISGVAADFVKPMLSEAIKNLPETDFTFPSPSVNENRIGISAGGIRQRAFYEQYYQLSIPDIIMTRINRGKDIYEAEIDDPRLPVLAIGYTETGKADNVEYYGVSGNWERNKYLRTLPVDTVLPIDSCRRNVFPQGITAQTNAIRPTLPMDDMVKACRWSYYNPITFVLSESPLYLFSLAEIDLLLAEVALKGLASTGKSAGQHINDAVVHSTDFWYMVNSSTNYAGSMSDETRKILTPAKPSANIVNAYAGTIQREFEAAQGIEDKMEILMQQKYIHLNIFEAYECFTELRRTRHPKLEPITCYGSSTKLDNQTMMIERFKLPTSERTNNYDEYSKVMKDDLWGNPVFWVPQDKINEKYFLPEAIKPALP
ncbi:MAG: SusD/RagB family nutrient-binding outer membrane lipoprotein, partial [Dysgonamonadaceae bacterium]|nr:SusD/RagB family nutrient-binding outer membrane lipoprotein [Dysgonamonadaceae bacterium]